ncbi:hypothetical protein JAO73_22155 [Hymenobacter sp. BT523]|jgi:hypothetical protein|uniref:hypothetical protein n=1 Tax=Hymenobacter sp. BT523 TaxID=2795725 RepID=UPI0018EDF319|nr:hypothetical protein [Hymenobacter sp. BT523]MBJ6111741.1 hypothetical protein [Hymenobacter sp. BT523]
MRMQIRYLGCLNLEASVFDCLHYLLGQELVGVDGENLAGVGRVHLPVAGTGLLVEGWHNGLDAAAIDSGLKPKGFLEEEK